jgi:alpha-galactosidase
MVFRSKNQLCKALKKYGLVTKRSIVLLKTELERVRAKCGWPCCPWLFYAAKTSRCSRFQVIRYDGEHKCAQNRGNKLVTTKVIAQRYEHLILANPMWKIESMKSTVLQDMFADVSTSKCKHAKKLVMDRLMCGMKMSTLEYLTTRWNYLGATLVAQLQLVWTQPICIKTFSRVSMFASVH